MRHLLFLTTFLLLVGVYAHAEDGLFIPIQDPSAMESIEDGKLVTRFNVKRINLIRATFRPDTEQPNQFWIELDFDEWHDPGDRYFFQLNKEHIQVFLCEGMEEKKEAADGPCRLLTLQKAASS